MRAMLVPALAGLCLLGNAVAGEPANDEARRINYAVGYQIGGDFRSQELPMDDDALLRGIRDALAGSEPWIPAAEMRTTLMDLKKRVVAQQQEQARERMAQAQAEGKAFLAQHRERPGVVTLPSGLQYRVLAEGTGAPAAGPQVTVHYRGTLPDGTEFDSTWRRGQPASFRLDQVIAGFREGLALMKPGARWELVIPPELAYRDKGPLAGRTVIFEVEMVAAR